MRGFLKGVASALFCVSCFMLAQAVPVSVSYQGEKGLIALQPLMPSGGGATKIGKMFVPGLTPQIVRTYSGADSPVKITEPRPTFIFKVMPQLTSVAGFTSRDIRLVRLRARKDHRELQVTTGASMFTFKAGTGENQLLEISVSTRDDGYIVTPKADLPAGEYMLFLGANQVGFDFSLRRE